MERKEKICFIASSGGHIQELSWLFSLTDCYDGFLVTERDGFEGRYTLPNTYYFDKIDRKEKGFFLRFLKLIRFSVGIFRKEKPDIILSTGALVSVPMLYIGKLMGRRIIYMESMARVDSRSLTGRLVYPIADLFLVQWESMRSLYPRAVYASRLFGEVIRP